MRLRGQSIGAINIFDSRVRDISAHEANIVQAFADVATIGILQERSTEQNLVLTAQLGKALETRVVIEQAKGVIAESLKVSVDEAFVLLRSHASSNESAIDGPSSDDHRRIGSGRRPGG